jgi:diguanylate cyclase (GGDEF)-like protein
LGIYRLVWNGLEGAALVEHPVDRVEVDRVEVDRVEVDRLEVDRVEVDRVEVDRVEVDGRGMVDVGLELTRRLRSAGRRAGPFGPTLALIAGLAVMAAGMVPVALGTLSDPVTPTGGVRLHGWLLLLVFAAAELSVVHVEIRREAHTFTFSEVALVLALLYADAPDLLVLRTVAACAVLLLVDRVSVLKLVFNLILFLVENCVLLLVFSALGGTTGVLDAQTWLAALVAAATTSAFGAVAVWAVIRVNGGDARPREELLAAGAFAASNGCLAAVTAALIAVDRWALVPLAIVVVVVVMAYRRHNRLSRRFAGLQALHAFTKATGEAVTSQQEVIAIVLESSRRAVGAGSAVLLLRSPPDGDWTQVAQPRTVGFPDVLRRRLLDDPRALVLTGDTDDADLRTALDEMAVPAAVVAPLLAGEDMVGALLIADRLRGTFEADDARLLSALAAQAAVALDRGRLIQQVHEQALAREHDALHDALTGLPNRVLFGAELERELGASRQADSRTAILLLDLDQFKEVNDTLGHHTGDQVLREAARRAVETVGQRGMVARLGGDEFAVLLPRLVSEQEATDLARRLDARITTPIRVTQLSLAVGASIGVAICPDHGDDGETLLQRADVAMYASKRAREHVVVYDAETDWSSPARLRLAADLRNALARGKLQVWYQPIAHVTDLTVGSVEALLRWSHPELGVMNPEDFIPIAERTGLIGPLTDYVLNSALQQSTRWHDAGHDIRIAVNLSVHALADRRWPAVVLAMLKAHSVPPSRLSFEITESGIMVEPERMTAVLTQLAESGLRLSVDDFGTGHSSLAYLQRLPVHDVKIDKSFVGPMAVDPGAACIVRSVVDLAHNLGLRTIAEGVEDQATLDALLKMGCDYLQGFHLAGPMPGDLLMAWLAKTQNPAGPSGHDRSRACPKVAAVTTPGRLGHEPECPMPSSTSSVMP